MYNLAILFLVLFCCPYCAIASEYKRIYSIPVNTPTVRALIPIYSQKLVFQLPSHWKVAFQNNDPTIYTIEFTPQDETIENWKNLISIQGFKDLSQRITSEFFLEDLASRFKAICGEKLIYEKLGSSKVDGYKSYAAILGCSTIPHSGSLQTSQGQSEIGYFLSIEGKRDIYLIQKSIRGEPFDTSNPPLNKDNIAAFIKPVTPIELCIKDGQQGECEK